MLLTIGTLLCIAVTAALLLFVFTIAIEECGWRYWLPYVPIVFLCGCVVLFIYYVGVLWTQMP